MGLSYNKTIHVVARDRKRGHVLLGGLGIFGVGQMWSEEDEYDPGRPGYADAPEMDSALDDPNTRNLTAELEALRNRKD